MELVVCFLLAMVITGGRAINDGIHAVKGTEPPHLTKARLRAERRARAAASGTFSRSRVEPEATAGDVARAYWGGAMADLLEHREKARAKRAEANAARQAGTPAPAKRPWWQPLAALGRLIVEPVGEGAQMWGPRCPDCGRRTDAAGTCEVCSARAQVEQQRTGAPPGSQGSVPKPSAGGRAPRPQAGMRTTANPPGPAPEPQSSVVHEDDHSYCLGGDCRTETDRHNPDGPPCPRGCGGRIVGQRSSHLDGQPMEKLCNNCGWVDGAGKPMNWHPCGWCGIDARFTNPDGVLTVAKNGATGKLICPGCDAKMRAQAATATNPRGCARCGKQTTLTHYASMQPICPDCRILLNHLGGDLEPYKSQSAPGIPGHEPGAIAVEASSCDCPDHRRLRGEQPRPVTEGENIMAATGDVYDVETCDRQLDELDDDLDTVNSALDTIDGAVGDIRAATERIEAFLRSKNADDTTVGGMAAVLDALGPDAIKTLIDAIAAAKNGVAATRDGLGPLREAKELVGATDGSILNNR
jgi:hypothetical protein